jgi:4'-phosphopantetheinyl transferase EntD
MATDLARCRPHVHAASQGDSTAAEHRRAKGASASLPDVQTVSWTERSPVIAELSVPPAITIEAPIHASADPLLWEEAEALGEVVPRRRREYVLGRHCARTAMRQLGFAAEPILVGSRREPTWPSHVVGSITHCDRWCAATVAPAVNVAAVGIDVEVDEPLPADVLDVIMLDDERHWVKRASTAIAWDRLIFSAKESVFKAWYPLTREWLGFENALIRLDPDNATFEVEISTARTIGAPANLEGRFSRRDGLIGTAVFVPHPEEVAWPECHRPKIDEPGNASPAAKGGTR